MKKLYFLVAGMCLLLMSSCSVTYHQVTNNPIGSKTGEAGGIGVFNPDLDFSFQAAADDGNIDKISTAEYKITYYVIIPHYRTRLTGE